MKHKLSHDNGTSNLHRHHNITWEKQLSKHDILEGKALQTRAVAAIGKHRNNKDAKA